MVNFVHPKWHAPKCLLQVMVNDYMLSIALCKFEGFSGNNLLVILKRGQFKVQVNSYQSPRILVGCLILSG